MHFKPLLAIATLSGVLAQTTPSPNGPYQQCGGITWKGQQGCVKGYTCVFIDPYYSQCLPISSSTLKTTLKASTTTPSTSTVKASTATVTSSTPGSTCTGTSSALRPRSSITPIIAVTTGTPATGLFLNRVADGTAVLATSLYYRTFTFSAGSLGATWFYLNPFCADTVYLNIDQSGAFSYKPLSWSYAQLTYDWAVPKSGDYIKTTPTSVYGEVSTFLACNQGGIWKLYLQTGSDLPSPDCVATKLEYDG